MTSSRQLEVEYLEDEAASKTHKWSVPLNENVFGTFMAKGNPIVNLVFGEGSLFSPYLFGKFFDPSDAFPLWEFQADILLSKLRSSSQTSVDWFHKDSFYALKAELPAGLGKNSVRVCAENGKVIEISGEWRPKAGDQLESDWRNGHWWEQGYVRRLELFDNVEWTRMEAYLSNDKHLEIRIPKKNHMNSDYHSENKGPCKDSGSA